MDLHAITERYDDRLQIDDYVDVDASTNGLQVGDPEMASEIDHVAFAVDAAIETIEAAAATNADLLVTHHGLIWNGLEDVTGQTHRRLAALFENNLALYAAHLPLDGHQELGNAATICHELDLAERAPFGTLGSEVVGQQGQLSQEISPEELQNRVATLTDQDRPVRLFDFGPPRIKQIGVVTGSGVDWVSEAAETGLDALVTGEGKQQLYHDAKELELNVLLAGHYATETFGIQSLAEMTEEWGLETTVIDCPTGL